MICVPRHPRFAASRTSLIAAFAFVAAVAGLGGWLWYRDHREPTPGNEPPGELSTRSLSYPGKAPRLLAFAPDGTRLYCVDADADTCAWQTETGELIKHVHDSTRPDDQLLRARRERHERKRQQVLNRHRLAVVLAGAPAGPLPVLPGVAVSPVKLQQALDRGRSPQHQQTQIAAARVGMLLGAGAAALPAFSGLAVPSARISRALHGPGHSVGYMSFGKEHWTGVSAHPEKKPGGQLLRVIGITLHFLGEDEGIKESWYQAGEVHVTKEGTRSVYASGLLLSPLRQVVFSPGGAYVLFVPEDGPVRLCQSKKMGQTALRDLRQLEGSETTNHLAISDAQVAAGAFPDESVIVWDLQTGKESGRYPGLGQGVRRLFLSSDGKRLILGGSGGLKVIDTQTGKLLRTLPAADASEHLAVSVDGTHALTVGGQTLQLWDLSTGEARNLRRPENVMRLALSADGKLAAALGDKNVWLWDLRN